MKDPRILQFATKYQVSFLGYLGTGQGQDGVVLDTDLYTAVKFFDSAARFNRELEVYLPLRELGIRQIGGHWVPLFIRSDEELKTIEMSIVDRPFVLDFAGAKQEYEVPDFEEHVMEEHYAHLRQLFDDRWTDALHVAEAFRQLTGFVLLDIHPGNIAFAD